MLLVFHVRLTLLVNMGPRVHFLAVLHDSSVQSGSVEICAVFLRRETKHLRPLSGEYLRAWHSPLVPNDIWITMLQNIYMNKLPRPINSLLTAVLNMSSYQSTVCTRLPSTFIVCVCLHRPRTHRAGRKFVCLPMWNFWPSVWVQCSMTTTGHVHKLEYSGSRETLWPMAALSPDQLLQSWTAAQLLHWILKSQGRGFVIVTPFNWQENSKAIALYFALRDVIICYKNKICSGTISLALNLLKSVCRGVDFTDWGYNELN